MKSKLHLQLASTGRPLCGRQLVNFRQTRVQVDSGRLFASTTAEFTNALIGIAVSANGVLLSHRAPFGCRHCGYAAGILVRTTTRVEDADQDEENQK